METLVAILINFNSEGIDEYDKTVCALTGVGSYLYNPIKLDLDLKNHQTPPVKPSTEEPLLLELKELSSHLRYVFIGKENTLPIVIITDLVEHQVEALNSTLRHFKRVIGWKIVDIISIPPGICTYKIQLEE